MSIWSNDAPPVKACVDHPVIFLPSPPANSLNAQRASGKHPVIPRRRTITGTESAPVKANFDISD